MIFILPFQRFHSNHLSRTFLSSNRACNTSSYQFYLMIKAGIVFSFALVFVSAAIFGSYSPPDQPIYPNSGFPYNYFYQPQPQSWNSYSSNPYYQYNTPTYQDTQPSYQNPQPYSAASSYSLPDAAVPMVGASSNASPTAADKANFNSFKAKYNKMYRDQAEEGFRLNIYVANSNKIKANNARPGVTYQEGENQFTDLTEAQFKRTYGCKFRNVLDCLCPRCPNVHRLCCFQCPYPIVGATAIDWTTKGKVGPIKNQGQCGSCWAFSTTGTVEINVAVNKSTTPKAYSEQQLVDCCGVRGFPSCYGCGGGWTGSAFNYIGSLGLTTSALYPYLAVASTCKDATVAKTKFLKTNPSYTQTNVLSTILSQLAKGAVSVIVDATLWSAYKSGIFSGCTGAISFNHAVILVGVDVSGNYKIRNSWGTTWGTLGYMWLSVTYNCGLTSYALTPILA